MKYQLTLHNLDQYREFTLDLPVDPEITWQDFVALRSVKDLLLANPNYTLLDVTPELTDEDTDNNADHFDIDSLLND